MVKEIHTLREVLENKSNDYTNLEIHFERKTGIKLVNREDYTFINTGLPKVTIVIPYFDSPNGLKYTLDSINNQKYIDYKFVDVLIVDDGSTSSPPDVKSKQFKFEVNIVKLKENMGRVRARNIGLLAATGEIIVFLDADMYLSDTTLYNHLFAHKHLNEPAILTGFREWVENDDKRLKMKQIQNKDIKLSADFRIKVTYDERHKAYLKDKTLMGKTVELVKETSNYKDLGNFTRYLGYSLQGQIHGFLFSLPRKKAIEAGPVGETEKGWGCDDLMLTSRFIASGCYVIPLKNSKGLHLYSIDRKRDERKLKKELDRNSLRYKELLDLPYLKFCKSINE